VLREKFALLFSKKIRVEMSFGLKIMLLLSGILAGCWRVQKEPAQEYSLESYILDAKKYIAENHPKIAIKVLEEYVRQQGNTPEITELLATACVMNGDDELAAFYFEQTASLSELSYHCYLNAVEIYEKMQDHEQALLCYKLYLQALPEDKEIQIRYANALIRNGQKKRALEILVSCSGDTVETRNQIAALFFELGNYVQARSGYLAALAMDKNDLSALKGLWTVDLFLKNWNALFEVGSKLLAFGVESLEGISIPSTIEAIREFRKSFSELQNIDLNFGKVELPRFTAETVERDLTLLRQEKEEFSGKNTTEKGATKQEKISELRNLAEKARFRGDCEEAIGLLWKILGIDGKNVEAWAELTECLQKANKYDIAEMAIREAIKFKPECVDFHLTYLDIVLRLHSSRDYVRAVKDAKRKFPRDAEIRLQWAKAQEMQAGDVVGAKRSYEKFIKLAPANHPEIAKVEHLLKTYKENQGDDL
jgi:tetratricopeptide (TPR) repeat protein